MPLYVTPILVVAALILLFVVLQARAARRGHATYSNERIVRWPTTGLLCVALVANILNAVAAQHGYVVISHALLLVALAAFLALLVWRVFWAWRLG